MGKADPAPRRAGPTILRVLLACLISGGLLLWVLKLGGPGSLIEALRPARPGLLLLAFLPYLGAYAGRVLRFRLLHARGSITALFRVVCVHNFLNRVLPLKLGEVSYPVLADRAGISPAPTATGDLVVARVLDLLVVMGLFLAVSALLPSDSLLASLPVRLPAAGILAACVLFLFFRETVFRWALQICAALSRPLGGIGSRISDRLLRPDAPASVAGARLSLPRQMATLAASLGIWSSLYLCFFLILAAYGVRVGICALVAGSTGAAVVGVLPVAALGSIGLFETGWALAFISVGVGQEAAVATGISTQVVTLIFALGLAVLPVRAAQTSSKSEQRSA